MERSVVSDSNWNQYSKNWKLGTKICRKLESQPYSSGLNAAEQGGGGVQLLAGDDEVQTAARWHWRLGTTAAGGAAQAAPEPRRQQQRLHWGRRRGILAKRSEGAASRQLRVAATARP
jgi:hypothetical protein